MSTNMELELAPRTAVTPMDLIQMAVSGNADLDKLEKLLELKREWEADEAKKAFVAAMAAFKREPILITKDRDNKQYQSKYTSLGNLVNTVTPFMSKHGLSADWEIDQSKGIKVTCVITHSMGHSKRVSFECGPDASGAKNPIQQIKSAITYAKACTFESACGLASSDANLDDDGNGVPKEAAGTPEERQVEQIDLIMSARTAKELFAIHAAAHTEAQKVKDTDAMKGYLKAKEARKAELQKEGVL